MITKEQVTAALKKIGPCSPGELADHLGTDTSSLGSTLKPMLDAAEVKAVGVTKSRRIALPDQKFDAPTAPPQGRRASKPKKKSKQSRKAPRQRSPRNARTAERFIPVVDAEKCLHVINGSEPVSYTEEQTTAIAKLLLQHYRI